MKLSQKDKSFLLLIFALLIVVWCIFSVFSKAFFSATFASSDIKKVISSQENSQWFNTSRPIQINDLKNRAIILDFWTYSCVSCIESINQIKSLEKELGSIITVIGVHSPMFESEKDYSAVKKAILRYDINHPVVNDSDLKIWNNFAVKTWPTFILINPHGREVKTYVGTKEVGSLIQDAKKLVSKHKFEISHEPLPILLEKYNLIGNVLSFPTKLVYAPNFSYKSRHIPVIFIANTSQNTIVGSSLTGEIIVKIGSKKSGLEDGGFEDSSFNAPQGLLYKDNKLYVADTGNHALRVADFKENTVKTLIGSGWKGQVVEGEVNDLGNFNLSSPNDLEFFSIKNNQKNSEENVIAISNSGTNQILSYDAKKQTISVLAGNGEEGINDGKYPGNSLAQTSDMSVFGHKLYFVDATSSSLRMIDESGNVKTLIKGKLSRNSNQSNESTDAKNITNNSNLTLQSPHGLIADDTGIYISDSLNHSIRKYDFNTKQLQKITGGSRGEEFGSKTKFDEPNGIISVLDRFYVADSNNNRILMINRGNLNSELLDVMPPLKLPKEGFLEYLPNLEKSEEVKVKAKTEILLKIDLEDGWKINELGPSFINLLNLIKEDKANLVASFDWNAVKSKEIKLPKLEEGQDYLIQGKIYFCKDLKNSLCYIKSYEQKIIANNDENLTQIDLKLGQ